MGRPPRVFASHTTSSSPSQMNFSSEYDTESIQSNLTDFLANELSNSNLLEEITNLSSVEHLTTSNNIFLNEDHDWGININDMALDINQGEFLLKNENNLVDYDTKQQENYANFLNFKDNPHFDQDEKGEEVYVPRIIQVTNYQEPDENFNGACQENEPDMNMVKHEHVSDEEEETVGEPIVCEKSLFNIGIKRKCPWEEFEDRDELCNKYVNYQLQLLK